MGGTNQLTTRERKTYEQKGDGKNVATEADVDEVQFELIDERELDYTKLEVALEVIQKYKN
jgi:hypothetical protein